MSPKTTPSAPTTNPSRTVSWVTAIPSRTSPCPDATSGFDHRRMDTKLGQLYVISGRHLWLHRSGTGGPSVVFLPGASAVGLDYLNMHERVAKYTTSVLNARAGTGSSDPAPLPRTAEE